MKTKNHLLFFIGCLLPTSSLLVAQSKQELSSNQESSPLMMFRAEEKKTETSDAFAQENRNAREATSANSSSDVARETASSAAEREDKETSLTLDHFQTALAQNPNAARLIIVEDEDGVISIQPRAAGTSRLSLKKNQLENEMILEELCALLAARHDEEATDSFFEGMNTLENGPLSAERLREILRRSDAALNNSQKTSSKKTPISTRSGSKTASHFEDSSVSEKLGADIRDNIQTLEKINLANTLSIKSDDAVYDFKKAQKEKKAEARKKREQKLHTNALESDTEAYLTPGTFIKNTAVKAAQAEAASSLLQGSLTSPEIKKLSAAERDVESYMRHAETARDKAIAASLTAERAKKNSSEQANFEEEKIAYTAAKKAWSDVAAVYESALEMATDAALETEELTNLLDQAAANELHWTAHLVELDARKKETFIIELPNESQASELAASWGKAVAAHEATLSKEKNPSFENKKWKAALINAQHQQALWTSKLPELQHARETQEAEKARAEKEKIEKEAAVAKMKADRIAQETATYPQTAAWRELVLEYKTKSAAAHAARKTKEGDSFYHAANKLEKAIKAEIADKPDVARLWREAAELNQQSVEPFTKAAAAHATGKKKASDSWDSAGHGFCLASDRLGKAIESELANEPYVAKQWREAAKLDQQSIESFIKAAEAYATGKTEEGDSWNRAGDSFHHAAKSRTEDNYNGVAWQTANANEHVRMAHAISRREWTIGFFKGLFGK